VEGVQDGRIPVRSIKPRRLPKRVHHDCQLRKGTALKVEQRGLLAKVVSEESTKEPRYPIPKVNQAPGLLVS